MSVMKFNHLVDEITKAAVSIELEHHEVHEGDAYSAHYFNTVTAGGEVLMYVQVPNTSARAHLKFAVETNLPGVVYLTEGFTVSGAAVGTVLAIYNFNRNSSSTSKCNAYHTPTVSGTAYGTTLIYMPIGGGNQQNRVGGSVRQGFEYIAKQNEKYLLRFIADTNGTKIATVAEWYEED